ncbi:hypothetical protein HPB50_022323 [Hyalomma asiaticum]|uniref:Uncharacterized protein n=1 Tax=Hyalomma asiaticum TaxID=266040 RepID=A0ACB7S240_HYAAI|nr:hypothetical protein HPB50_022323 [Hyalomma asiaticum]
MQTWESSSASPKVGDNGSAAATPPISTPEPLISRVHTPRADHGRRSGKRQSATSSARAAAPVAVGHIGQPWTATKTLAAGRHSGPLGLGLAPRAPSGSCCHQRSAPLLPKLTFLRSPSLAQRRSCKTGGKSPWKNSLRRRLSSSSTLPSQDRRATSPD